MMLDWYAFYSSGAALLLVAAIFWAYSLMRNDVSIVDSLWSMMFLLAAVIYFTMSPQKGPREVLVMVLVTLWAIRLTIYITLRNHGQPEDYRYQEIRKNNSPGFRFKSLYLVFGLQAILAWVISVPLLAAISGRAPIELLDYVGVTFWIIGMIFESAGDLQLSRFKRKPENKGKVLDSGLWRFTRHPNYFGNFMLWWGFYLIALSAGAWWTIFSPLLMTFLLLRVSGVALLERDISERRPQYVTYVRRTNAFFPGPVRD